MGPVRRSAPRARVRAARPARDLEELRLGVRLRARDAEGVTAPATEIAAAALELAPLRARLGVPEGEHPDELPEVDPLAVPVASVYVRSLPEAPEVTRATAVTGEALGALLGQHTELVRLYETAEQLGSDVADSRALVALVQGRAVRRVVRKVRALLADPSLPLGAREKLQSDAAELLRLAAEEQEQRRSRRKRTIELGRATEAEVQTQARRRRLVETMVALRQGKEVAPEAVAEASRTYEEILGERRQGDER